eukprot:4523416-Prorocentrum_lima.AAC.1
MLMERHIEARHKEIVAHLGEATQQKHSSPVAFEGCITCITTGTKAVSYTHLTLPTICSV